MNLAGRVAVAGLALASALPVACGRSSYRGTYDPSELHREAGVPMTQVGDREVAVFVKPQTNWMGEPLMINWRDYNSYAIIISIDDQECLSYGHPIEKKLPIDEIFSVTPFKIHRYPNGEWKYVHDKNAPHYLGPLEQGLHKIKVALEVKSYGKTRRKFVGRLDPKSDDLGFIEEKVPDENVAIKKDRQLQYFTSAGGPTIVEVLIGGAEKKHWYEQVFGYKLKVFTSEPRVPKIKTETKIVGEDKSAHFCSSCGTQLAESAKFCSGCGTKR